jgi:hypothetical protein
MNDWTKGKAMETNSPDESLGMEAASKQSQQDATNSAMEALMMAVQRYGAEQGRFANIPSTFEDALLTRLEALTAQLAPLRQLSPTIEEPSEAVVAQLAALRRDMARLDFSGAKRLDPGTRPCTNPFTGATVAPIVAQSA